MSHRYFIFISDLHSTCIMQKTTGKQKKNEKKIHLKST